MAVFSNPRPSITDEMGANLIGVSFLTNVKARRDCSVGLFGADSKLIAQAAHIPLHLGSLTVPERSVITPRFPAAVGARSITCQKIAGAV